VIDGRKVIVVMPAYNAAATLARNVVDDILLVED
jgi:hypothetical protein